MSKHVGKRIKRRKCITTNTYGKNGEWTSPQAEPTRRQADAIKEQKLRHAPHIARMHHIK